MGLLAVMWPAEIRSSSRCDGRTPVVRESGGWRSNSGNSTRALGLIRQPSSLLDYSGFLGEFQGAVCREAVQATESTIRHPAATDPLAFENRAVAVGANVPLPQHLKVHRL